MNREIDLKRHCPICQETRGIHLRTFRFSLSEGHPLNPEQRVVICKRCGFGFSDTEVSQEQYNHYYQILSKYSDVNTSTGGGSQDWDEGRLTETAAQIFEWERDPEAKILDVGCANGGLLLALKKLGYQKLYGVDPSEACVKNAIENSGVKVEQGSLNFGFKKEFYHGVVLSHVIEHVRELRESMQLVYESLQPQGWIYIEVPEASRYGDYLSAPFQDFNLEHINHFSLESLSNLIGVSGFQEKKRGSKTIFAAKGIPYPACWMIAVKNEKGVEIKEDSDLKDQLIRYCDLSEKFLKKIRTQIQEILEKNNQVIVWGTGQLTMKLLEETSLTAENIKAFVDKNPINQGKRIHGITVLAPDQIRDLPEAILIGSLVNHDSIKNDIQAMNLSNRVYKMI